MKTIAHLVIRKWWISVCVAIGISVVALVGIVSPGRSGEVNEVEAAYKLKEMLDGEFGSDGSECLIVVDVVEVVGDLFCPWL